MLVLHAAFLSPLFHLLTKQDKMCCAGLRPFVTFITFLESLPGFYSAHRNG